MARTARVPVLPLQPAEGVFHQGRGLLTLRCGTGGGGTVAGIEQQHQGGRQLFCSPPLGLPLQGVPIALTNPQLLVQLARRGLGLRWPLANPGWAVGAGCGHWTTAMLWRHPGAMHQRHRSPYTPIRWLHQLAALMAQVSRAERLDPGDDSLQARRLRQRLALAQRVLDPLPRPLQPAAGQERALWRALRWAGPAMALSLWLHR